MGNDQQPVGEIRGSTMQPQCDIGMIGLGVMGSNLALNMADHGFTVAGYDANAEKDRQLRAAEHAGIRVAASLDALLALLKSPRRVMLMVPAGKPVDAVLATLRPLLSPGDIVIDGGNSHFTDTNARQQALAEARINLLGVGVSGGEEGARRGPCLMPGGAEAAYAQVQPILAAIAAHFDNEPCVAYLGPGAAGHYVKMVHNGIEYGLMEVIAESYDLMKRGLGLNDDELHAIYAEWSAGDLAGFLMEITAKIFLRTDPQTGKRLVNLILDVARQKGTGMWTSQDAMALHVPVPVIDAAVAMRDLSGFESERQAAARLLAGPTMTIAVDRPAFLAQLHNALYTAMLITYAQGMRQLRGASQAYSYALPFARIARIWRGGCIIRAALLEEISAAFTAQPELEHLLLDRDIARELKARQADLRAIVATAAGLGIPTAGFSAALAYYDALRSRWLPANLIQAQRDFFGAHTYERVDEPGTFHTEWE